VGEAKGLRAELLDRTLIWNETHLRHKLREYERHYNLHRTHRSLAAAAPLRALPVALEPSETSQGSRWLGNFRLDERRAATLLIDSLRVISSSRFRATMTTAVWNVVDKLPGPVGVYPAREVPRMLAFAADTEPEWALASQRRWRATLQANSWEDFTF
jgi:hypothetical protein